MRTDRDPAGNAPGTADAGRTPSAELSAKEKLLRAVGLCRKAGRLIAGTDAVCDALAEKKKPFAVFCAEDNAENTAKRLSDKCRYYGVRLVILPAPGEALARAIGKTGRCAAVAVTDENLCRLVLGTYEKNLND